jgi:hypothetical protein
MKMSLYFRFHSKKKNRCKNKKHFPNSRNLRAFRKRHLHVKNIVGNIRIPLIFLKVMVLLNTRENLCKNCKIYDDSKNLKEFIKSHLINQFTRFIVSR